jgi:hypothetical protein
MTSERQAAQGFWSTVWLLLNSARRRAKGRRRRQQELLNQRSGKSSATNWGGLGYAFSVIVFGAINVLAAVLVGLAVDSGQTPGEDHRQPVVSL